MRSHPVTWALRILWVPLPLLMGDAVTAAVAEWVVSLRWTVASVLWVGWAAGLVASLVPRPASLTATRLLGPLAPAVALWAVLSGERTAASLSGLVVAVVIGVLATTGWVADDLVDGASYGDERRFSLRAPGALVLGPIPLAWAVTVGGALGGPLLLATHRWVLGTVLTVVGVPVSLLALRSLHSLSTRWLVFVPAGVTLVDPMSLAASVLFPRATVSSLEPALVGSEATDLSQRALGLALELRVDPPAQLTVRTTGRRAEEQVAGAVLFTPAIPGAVLSEARRRNLPAQRATPPPTTTSPS